MQFRRSRSRIQVRGPNSLAILVPIGEPSPVQGSGPRSARKAPLFPSVMSLKHIGLRQSTSAMKPSFRPKAAKRPAYKGATALVPPRVTGCPLSTSWYLVLGSACAARSGTILPGPFGAPICQTGRGWKMPENPPPVPVPMPVSSFPGFSFQTTSSVTVLVVPPHARICGHEEGKSTNFGPGPPSLESLSPEAARITILFCSIAACAALSTAGRADH